MIRCPSPIVSVLSFIVVVAAVGAAGPAAADPRNEPSPDPSCVYTLSAPELVSMSGVLMVTATLAPLPCTGSINPNSMTVCVSMQGESSDGQCVQESKPIPARVLFAPYRPGMTYESTGRGCGSVFTLEGAICTSVGPKTATL